jgi:hypothetical protein
MATEIRHVSRAEFHRKNKIAFAVFFATFAIGITLFFLMKNAEEVDGLPGPLRKGVEINSTVFGENLLNPMRVEKSRKTPVRGKKPRVNGRIGIEEPIDLAAWKMEIVSPSQAEMPALLSSITMMDLVRLPKIEVTNEFKCIEGWSEVMSFAGVRFIDFLKAHRLGTKSGQEPDLATRPHDLYKYVGLETPDGEYYVSIDMRSMMNPQTLLAYEQNGEALSLANGAPLRLYIPNKYGVKSLKRIGKITFSDEPPPDFWGEQGYDYFIGL